MIHFTFVIFHGFCGQIIPVNLPERSLIVEYPDNLYFMKIVPNLYIEYNSNKALDCTLLGSVIKEENENQDRKKSFVLINKAILLECVCI